MKQVGENSQPSEVSKKITEFEGLMSVEEAAAYLKFSPGTLNNMRSKHRGPKYVHMGRLIRYRRKDLDKYIDEQIRDPECA